LRSTSFLIFVCASSFAGVTARPVDTGLYVNREFGITAAVPAGLRWCDWRGESHDHGPVVFLDANDVGSCDFEEHRRAISIFSFFNATDDTKTLEGLRQWCIKMVAGTIDHAPKDLRIAGCLTAAARVNRGDGWVDVFVAAQTPPSATANREIPGVNHCIRLHTDLSHLSEDLKVFRRVLTSIRFRPPDGS
jgi:hypothetical protein